MNVIDPSVSQYEEEKILNCLNSTKAAGTDT